MTTDRPIINSGDRSFNDGLYLMWAGQIGTQRGYVWADSYESAFETWVEYLDEHAPGCLVSHEDMLGRLDGAARDDGFESWAWLQEHQCDHTLAFGQVIEAAETDLTLIGHTSLEHGSHIASAEWGFDEIEQGSPEYRLVDSETAREVLQSDMADLQAQLGDAYDDAAAEGASTLEQCLYWHRGQWQLDACKPDGSPYAWLSLPIEISADDDGEYLDPPDWGIVMSKLVDSLCEAIARG